MALLHFGVQVTAHGNQAQARRNEMQETRQVISYTFVWRVKMNYSV